MPFTGPGLRCARLYVIWVSAIVLAHGTSESCVSGDRPRPGSCVRTRGRGLVDNATRDSSTIVYECAIPSMCETEWAVGTWTLENVSLGVVEYRGTESGVPEFQRASRRPEDGDVAGLYLNTTDGCVYYRRDVGRRDVIRPDCGITLCAQSRRLPREAHTETNTVDSANGTGGPTVPTKRDYSYNRNTLTVLLSLILFCLAISLVLAVLYIHGTFGPRYRGRDDAESVDGGDECMTPRFPRARLHIQPADTEQPCSSDE